MFSKHTFWKDCLLLVNFILFYWIASSKMKVKHTNDAVYIIVLENRNKMNFTLGQSLHKKNKKINIYVMNISPTLQSQATITKRIRIGRG